MSSPSPASAGRPPRESSRVAEPHGLGTVALICIDMQCGAFDGVRCPPLDGADDLLREAAALQDAARRAGTPVLHVRHVEADPGAAFEEGTPHAELHPAVAPAPGEALVVKRVGNAFEGTDLHQRLQGLGVDTLVLCGLQTDFCVRATAHGALSQGYRVRLAAGAHGTWPLNGRSAPQIVQAVQDELAALGVPCEPAWQIGHDRLRARAGEATATQIRLDDLRDPRVGDLLSSHRQAMFALSPAESVHALDLGAFRHPDLRLWTAWSGNTLLGCAALKRLSADHGEVKSMRTAPEHLRRGVARALLAHVQAQARAAGMTRLSLETGTAEAFWPAHRLYEAFGFERCGPFDGYVEDPHSVFMTRAL